MNAQINHAVYLVLNSVFAQMGIFNSVRQAMYLTVKVRIALMMKK